MWRSAGSMPLRRKPIVLPGPSNYSIPMTNLQKIEAEGGVQNIPKQSLTECSYI